MPALSPNIDLPVFSPPERRTYQPYLRYAVMHGDFSGILSLHRDQEDAETFKSVMDPKMKRYGNRDLVVIDLQTETIVAR